MNLKIPFIVAHRGASQIAPENTIAAFNLAFEQQADFIEGDFWLTNDNEIVCIHDSNTSRVSNKKLKISSSTLSELRKLDVGSWKHNKFSGEKIPTLKEILKLIPNGKGIQIEIKDKRENILYSLNEILKSSSTPTENIRIISFHRNILRAAKKFFPDIKVYLIFSWYFSKGNYFKEVARQLILNKLETVSCDGVVLYNNSYIDKNFVSTLKELNLDICVYNVEEENEAIRLTSIGVDAITTNSPMKIREAIIKNSVK